MLEIYKNIDCGGHAFEDNFKGKSRKKVSELILGVF